MVRSFLVGAVVSCAALGCAKPPSREPPTFTTLDVGSAGAARALETTVEPDSANGPLRWASDPEAGLAEAVHRKRGLVVVFCAAWSAACHELDAALVDPTIQRALAARFVAVRVDMTDEDAADVTRRAQTFAVHGLPTLIVFDRKGHEVARVEQYMNARDLERVLERVQ